MTDHFRLGYLEVSGAHMLTHINKNTRTIKYTTFSSGSILARERSMDRHVRQSLLSALKENSDL